MLRLNFSNPNTNNFFMFDKCPTCGNESCTCAPKA